MKLNKEEKKALYRCIKKNAKEKGFSFIDGSIYKICGENFIHADYLVVDSCKLIFWICVKKYIYDNLFWKIMGMESNINARKSLRANGAFVAPSVVVLKGEMELSENIEDIAREAVLLTEKSCAEFLKSHEIAQYILEHHDLVDNQIMKCLVYAEREEYEKAIAIAQEEINKGDRGRFVNEDKGFFERVLMYYNDCKPR